MAATAELKLLADVKQAVTSINGFAGSAGKALKGVESSFGALKAVAIGAVGFLVGSAVVNTFKDWVKAAAEADDNLNALESSMRTAGQFSQAASVDLQNFAAEIQRTTKFEGDLIVKQLALAQSYGLTNEQSKLAAQAAIELSAATGKDLDSAMRTVTETFNGSIGKLGKLNPEMKNLTQAQLEAGGAAKLLIDQLGGRAASELNTFSGAMAQLENIQGDFVETLGDIIIKNPAVIASIKTLSDTFSKLTGFISSNNKTASTFITAAIKGMIKTLPTVVDVIGKVGEAFIVVKFGVLKLTSAFIEFFKFAATPLGYSAITDQLLGLATTFTAVIGGILKSIEVITKPFPQFALLHSDMKASVDALDELGAKLEENKSTSSVRTWTDDLIDYQKELDASAEKTGDDMATLGGIMSTVRTVAVGMMATFDANHAAASAVTKEQNEGLEEQVSWLDKISEKLKSIVPENAADATKMGAEFMKSVLGGKGGAENLLKKTATVVADAFLPGLGPIVGEIVGVLAQGKEAVKSFISDFLIAIPDMIVNILEALPEIIPAFVESFIDSFILGGGIVRLVDATLKLIPRLAVGLGEAMMDIFKSMGAISGQRMSDEAKKGLQQLFDKFKLDLNLFKFGRPAWLDTKFATPDWITDLQDSFSNFIGNIFVFGDNMRALFEWLPDAIKSVFGGSGGSSSWGGGKWKDRVGLSEGIVVPDGFPNDSFAANLSSGELVMPNKTADKLFSLIDKLSQQSGGSPTQITISIGESELAKVMLNLNRRGFRTA